MIPTITTVPLLHLASGDRFSLQIYRFVGHQPGKIVYIQSNLHGDEISGNSVIYDLITFLETLDVTDLQGEIRLVPVCNPLGVNQRTHHFSTGRFNPYDGENWNRIFWDYEHHAPDLPEFAQSHLEQDVATIQANYRNRIQARFAELATMIQSPRGVPFTERYRFQLQSLCLDADYVLDLHSSSDQGLDYLYYFRDRQDSARLFALDAGILLDAYEGNAFDEAFIKPWLALERCFADLGRPLRFDVEAWTLELGSGMQSKPSSVAKGVQGIKNYLRAKAVLKISDRSGMDARSAEMRFVAHTQVAKYYAPVGGIIQSRVPLGSRVQAGQRLYQVLSFNKVGKLPTLVDVDAEQPGLVYDLSTNQAVNEGEYVLGIL